MLGVKLMNNEKRNTASDAVIINIASLVGLDPFHLMPIYTASKHAIVGFSRAYSVKMIIPMINFDRIFQLFINLFLQHAIYCNGVRICILCPGATTTNFVRQFSGNMIVPNESEALEYFRCVPKQSSKQVAEHTIQLIESAENGSIWLSDNGELTNVDMTAYCPALTSLEFLSV